MPEPRQDESPDNAGSGHAPASETVGIPCTAAVPYGDSVRRPKSARWWVQSWEEACRYCSSLPPLLTAGAQQIAGDDHSVHFGWPLAAAAGEGPSRPTA